MKHTRRTASPVEPEHFYHGLVPMAAIRKYARQIAEQFKPDKIILFGSYAYGTPNEDSDVDLLVIMPTWSQHSKEIQILRKLEPRFSLDLIVRTPSNLGWRLEERESFHTEIVSRGKVLYEKDNPGVGASRRGRLAGRRKTPRRKQPSQ